MKRFSLTVIVVMLCGMMAFSQGKPACPNRKCMNLNERAERMTKRMTSELGLSDEQQGQVKVINLTFYKEMQEYQQKQKSLKRMCRGKNVASFSEDTRQSLEKVSRKEMRKLNKYAKAACASRNTKLKSVLTPVQYATFEKLQTKRKVSCTDAGFCLVGRNNRK